MTLEEIITKYRNAPLECDGMTKVLFAACHQNNIPCVAMEGSLSRGNFNCWHMWLKLPDGRYVDLRARMWVGHDDAVPDGIFNASDFPEVKYEGQEVFMYPLMPELAEAMCIPFPVEMIERIRRQNAAIAEQS